MKNIWILTLLIISISFVIGGETIENIRSELDGEQIVILYDFPDAAKDKIYSVNITCSIDGADPMKLVSVTGDVGDNVKGGMDRKAVWDVLNDVDEIGSAEFFVSANLKAGQEADLAEKQVQKKNGSFRDKKWWKIAKWTGISAATLVVIVIIVDSMGGDDEGDDEDW